MLLNKRRLTTLLLILILIIAAVVRIGWPGLTEFKYDEAQMMRRAVLLLSEGRMPVSIESSVAGLPYPPLMVYVLALPLAFVRSPEAAVIFIALLGVGSVALTIVLGARYYNLRVGVLAAALFAVAPWAVFYSRKIWGQNIPLLTLILMVGLHAFVIRQRLWGLLVAGVTALYLSSLYLGNLVFIPIVVLAVAIHPRALREGLLHTSRQQAVRWLSGTAAALIVLTVLIAPWIQAAMTGELNQGTGDLITATGEPTSLQPLEQAQLAAKIATGYQFHALAGDHAGSYAASLPVPGLLDALDWVVMWLVWIAAVYVVIRAVMAVAGSGADRYAEGRYTLLALWLIVPVLVWTFSGLPPQPHRYIGLYPAQFLALAVLVNDGLERLGTRIGSVQSAYAAVSLLASVVIVWQLIEYATMMRLIDTTVVNYGHGPAAQIQWDAAREARRLAEPDNLPIVVNGTGDDPDTEGEAAAWDVLLGDLDLRLIEGEAVTVNPARGAVHLYTRADATYDMERIEGQADDSPAAAKLANGIEFLHVEPAGLEAQIEPGADVSFSAIWRVWGIPPTGEDYSYSIQLFDANWLRYVNLNDHFLRTAYWREGDVVGTSGVLRIPNDAPANADYHLVITLYTVAEDGTVTPVAVVNEAFNKIGEYVEVPLN